MGVLCPGSLLSTKALLRVLLAIGFLLFLGRLPGRTSFGSGKPDENLYQDLSLDIELPRGLDLPCSQLPGADKTLVVMKTGAAELEAKLPTHFNTTFRCYPNYLVFSDYGEVFEDHVIIDALAEVSPTIQKSNPDFALWRRLQKHGRSALTAEELSGPDVDPSNVDGRLDSAGWKLDKWKFLPMLKRSLALYPDMEWFVFVEPDTHIFWSSTLAYLQTLNPDRPHYVGAQMQIGESVFAHGGSAFILSHTSVRAAVALFEEEKDFWESMIDQHWAGDSILGDVLRKSGTELTWAWPTFQGMKPGAIDYATVDYDKREYCYPVISSHHMSSKEIEELWLFEQVWMARGHDFVRHRDVFHGYIMPQIRLRGDNRAHWNNLSGDFDNAMDAQGFVECRWRCRTNATCVQYSFKDSKCAMTDVPRLGEYQRDVYSGWELGRVQQIASDMAPCGNEGWIK
ncbi:glycosyltransferase family 31 protein [Hortaea werneckii]|nr:glycosyltransferase family 31 protein [Hortaea werneckii]